MSLLAELKNLKVYFYDQGDKRFIRAVEDVGLRINEGSVLGVVGESGCGKTVTALSMMGLIESEPGIIGGEFYFRPPEEDTTPIENSLTRKKHDGESFKKENLFNLFYGLENYVSFKENPFRIIKDSNFLPENIYHL